MEQLVDEKVRVAGVSTKSKLQNLQDRRFLEETINEAINRMPLLEAFVVYDVSSNNRWLGNIFKTAIEKEIKIIVPDNSLKIRKHNKKQLQS